MDLHPVIVAIFSSNFTDAKRVFLHDVANKIYRNGLCVFPLDPQGSNPRRILKAAHLFTLIASVLKQAEVGSTSASEPSRRHLSTAADQHGQIVAVEL